MPALLELIDTNPVFTAAKNAYLPFEHCPDGESIGTGQLCDVTAADLDGQQYAIRKFTSNEYAKSELLERLPALELGLGRSGLEQLVAFSTEDGVLVTERMDGQNLEAVGLEEAAAMEKEQFATLAITVDSATRSGIAIDDCVSNIFYAPDKGFGLIDYLLPTTVPSTGRLIKGLGQAMMWMGHDLRTFDSRESLQLRERAIRMVTQAGFSILSQRDSRALVEAADEWIARCKSGDLMTDAE